VSYELALAVTILTLIVVLLPLIIHLSRYLGPKSIECTQQNEVYESGIRTTISDCFERFSVKYYLVAIFFIIFDVEILFMFPWAVTLRETGMLGLIDMFVFMGLLLAGLAYIYRRGVLKWQ